MRQDVSKTVAVLGASGRTGRLVVSAAVDAGHDVVALVRRRGSVPGRPGVREAVWAEPTDQAALAAALAGVDVVISALGGADKGPTTVCGDAIRTVLPLMHAAGVGRLIAVSAYGVLETHDRSLYARAVWAGVGEKLKDKETMERLVVGSALDWTLVRPAALKDGPATGRYRVGTDLPVHLWSSVGRADLADFLVHEADEPRFVGGHPRIHR